MQALSKSLVISEEKRLFFLNRSSHGSTKLVAPKRGSIPLVEEIRRVERVVAQILECSTMPLIRSRLRRNHHLCAGPLAELSSVRVALHVELAHGVHAQ